LHSDLVLWKVDVLGTKQLGKLFHC